MTTVWKNVKHRLHVLTNKVKRLVIYFFIAFFLYFIASVYKNKFKMIQSYLMRTFMSYNVQNIFIFKCSSLILKDIFLVCQVKH